MADMESHYRNQGAPCEADGRVRRFVNIYVNGDDIRFLANLDTREDGDEVSIVPAIAVLEVLNAPRGFRSRSAERSRARDGPGSRASST